MDCKVIIRPSIARTLLHKGNPIVDIKPNKDKPLESVFVFENNQKLMDDLTAVLKQ